MRPAATHSSNCVRVTPSASAAVGTSMERKPVGLSIEWLAVLLARRGHDGCGDGAELLKHTQHVRIGPARRDLAVADLKHVSGAEADLLARRRDAQERAGMAPAAPAAHQHLIAFGQHLLDLEAVALEVI